MIWLTSVLYILHLFTFATMSCFQDKNWILLHFPDIQVVLDLEHLFKRLIDVNPRLAALHNQAVINLIWGPKDLVTKKRGAVGVGIQHWTRLMAYAVLHGLDSLIAKLETEKVHFLQCWWKPTTNTYFVDQTSRVLKHLRGSSCEPLFKNLTYV